MTTDVAPLRVDGLVARAIRLLARRDLQRDEVAAHAGRRIEAARDVAVRGRLLRDRGMPAGRHGGRGDGYGLPDGYVGLGALECADAAGVLLVRLHAARARDHRRSGPACRRPIDADAHVAAADRRAATHARAVLRPTLPCPTVISSWRCGRSIAATASRIWARFAGLERTNSLSSAPVRAPPASSSGSTIGMMSSARR